MSTRLPGLDGLRGVAVLAVVVFHLGYAPSGFLGVDVFFVLSGYLITGLLRAELQRTGTLRLGRFTLRRLLRLYPALLAMVAVVIALSLVMGQAVGDTVGDAVAALTYTGNLTRLHGLLDHVWTLGLEEQFYLAWPVLLLVCRSKRGWVLPAVLIAALLVTDLVHGQSGALHSYVRAMGLPVGCALASNQLLRKRVAPAGPVCLVVLLVAFLVPLPAWLSAGWPVSGGALLTAPVVAWLATDCPTWLSTSALQWAGLRSYSLYLWHFPLVALWFHHAPAAVPHGGSVLLAVLTSGVAAELSYRLVEQPVLQRRDRGAGHLASRSLLPSPHGEPPAS